ncbi:MAG: hypothetical protein AB1489_08790 [Acidobacteriota bacterium]
MKYQKWIDQLGIRLPVRFRPSTQTQICSPLRGMTDQEHILEIDQTAWQSDILISLCQAVLAERIDPLFSTYYFDEHVTTESCQIFIQATSPILDIWASDVAFQIEPAMMREEISELVLAIEPDEETLDLDMLASVATLLAQVRRYDINVELEIVEHMIDDYVTYLATLPTEPTLTNLKEAACTVCRILGLPEPELSFSDVNVAIWKIPFDIPQLLREQQRQQGQQRQT